jgi:hypothetical protein
LAVLEHLLLQAQLPPSGDGTKLPIERPVGLRGCAKHIAVQ